MRINRQIRASQVRLIDPEGNQVGVVSLGEAQRIADQHGLDLVEISPNAVPPVCKVIDYGKFRYDQTKREKESKKAQHQIKVKEVKLKPNIDEHDFQFKVRRAREFLQKGNKVKLSCFFRGREMAHAEIGEEVVRRFCEAVADLASPESPPKLLGRSLIAILAPAPAGKRR
ncbi:MAG: translation initiation factor IF-3 [Parachlamydiales bacterium]